MSLPITTTVSGKRSLLPLAASVLVALAAFFWQAGRGTIPDTSWLIHVAERVLAGDRLYVDLIETNPPFSVWLYLPSVWLAGKMSIAPELVVHAFTILNVLGGLGIAALVVWRSGLPEAERLYHLLPVLVAIFVLLPGNAFSQREHIGTALLLPLLAQLAWRLRTAGAARPGIGLSMAVGLAASILVLTKPHYAVVVLLPTLLVAWRTGRWTIILALEYWVIGAACVAYLVLVLWLHPAYVETILPLLADSYLQATTYWGVVLSLGGTVLAMAGVIWVIWPKGRLPALATIMSCAALASLVPPLIQAKGWPYHGYPALTLGLIAVLCLAAGQRWSRTNVLLCIGAAVVAWTPYRGPFGPSSRLVSLVRTGVPQPKVAMLGADIAVGHPLVRMAEARWMSAYCSDWLGTIHLYLERKALAAGQAEKAGHHAAMAADFLTVKLAELENATPDIILVQSWDRAWIDHLQQDTRFVTFMAGYAPAGESDGVTVLRRIGTDAPASPAAASG